MRVLYFHQHFSTPKGASGIRSYEMALELIKKGHQVTIVCGSYGVGRTGLEGEFVDGVRRGSVDGINVIEFNLNYSNSDGFLIRTITFLKYAFKSSLVVFKEKYDVIFATTTPLTAGIPGIIAKTFLRKKFIFEVRDLWPELPKAMGVIKNPLILFGMSVLEWLSYKSADKLIGLAPGIVDGIKRIGIHDSKVKLIPNGCDLKYFDANEKKWRPQEVHENDFMAIFTGTHGIANGLDALIDVASELKERGRNDIKLVLVGDGKLKKGLMDEASLKGLNNIIFHPSVDKKTLSGLMESADIGLQILSNVPAFYYGTSPNKFFDYIASGLPVLNNYPGWLADLIKENNCGVAVPPDNKVVFTDTLVNLADNRKVLVEMGVNARKLAKKSFDRKKLASDWVEWVTN